MYPAYTWTDSYPHQPKDMIPSNMKMDLSSPRPPLYQPPWQYGGNYPYHVPHQYHTCCNHSCYGSGPYSFWPPYAHYPPPPPLAYHPYPPFPGPYPAYSVPPQHYSVEQPRYEYDKNNHAPHHCCGCNHNQWEDEKGPKIKEEPQVENKNGNESLVPLLLKDRPEYPIMWVPRGYISNGEPKVKEKKGSRDFEASKQGGNGEIMWVPRGYISNSEPKVKEKEKNFQDLEASKQGGNGEMIQDEEGGGGNRFPFKIFWLPSKNDEVGKDAKERNLDQVANKGLLSDEKTTKKSEGFGSEGEHETRKHAAVAPVKQASTDKEETRSKHSVQKVVPVKQASANKEETSGKHAVQKVIPVKQASTNEEKNQKSTENIVNSDSVEKTDNGSKASPRTSKLPPVCLRVDPLPRKKKSSRSPSPTEKGRSTESLVNSPKSSQQQAQALKKSKEEQDEGHIETNKVERDNLARPGDVPRGKGDESDIKTVDPANKVERDNLAGHGDVPREKGDESEKREVKEKRKLSEHEAAVIIQSVYRGFEVRKSQPLKKLRQIHEVRNQVSELRDRIQNLESSSPAVHIDGKTKLIIGETIMSLLLKLDTIQGLHPFVREARKSVAKELVGLQEKLDYLTSEKSEASGQETTSSAQQVMPPEDDAIHGVSVQAGEETMSSPQQIMPPEDDALPGKSDQAQTHTSLSENHENTATESQCDGDAAVCDPANLEQELEKKTEGDGITDKSHQAPTESDTVICETPEVKATESHEGCNTVDYLQLGLHRENLDQAPTERDGSLGLCVNQEAEATESQEGCNSTDELQLGVHKEKLDLAPAEREEALGLCQNHKVESTESQEGCNTIGEAAQLSADKEKFDKSSTERDAALESSENHEVATTELVGADDTMGEPQLESHEVELGQAPTEAPRLCENHEAEAAESQEGCNTISEPQLESHEEKLDQAPTEVLGLSENHEAEATESQEICNTIGEPQLEPHDEKLDQAPTEALELCENHEVESNEGCNAIGEPQMESHKEKLDQSPTESDNYELKAMDCVVNGGADAHDMKPEHNLSKDNNNQLQMPVETEVHASDTVQELVQGTKFETMVHDLNAPQSHEVETAESCNDSSAETCDNNNEQQMVPCGSVDESNVQMDDGNKKSESAEDNAAKEIQEELAPKGKDVEVSRGGLAEENEKLRMAVEELMKAGNDQLGVIRELTGRVKDLEKKLSKKKKFRVNSKGRRPRGFVVQKD